MQWSTRSAASLSSGELQHYEHHSTIALEMIQHYALKHCSTARTTALQHGKHYSTR